MNKHDVEHIVSWLRKKKIHFNMGEHNKALFVSIIALVVALTALAMHMV